MRLEIETYANGLNIYANVKMLCGQGGQRSIRQISERASKFEA